LGEIVGHALRGQGEWGIHLIADISITKAQQYSIQIGLFAICEKRKEKRESI